MQEYHWRLLKRNTIVSTPFLKVHQDKVRLPSGEVIDDYSIVSLPHGVAVVATDGDDNLITIFEYKYAINSIMLNLPAGSIEQDESVLEVAARELLEETGYVSDDLEYIQALYEYPSKADHVIHVVRARNAHKTTEVKHEATENISPVQLISPAQALAKDYKGAFNATYTVAALALTLPEFIVGS